MNIVYIMCGPMGSGKSYVSQNLFGHLQILNPDDFRTGEFNRNNAHDAWDSVHKKIREILTTGNSFVIDSSMALQISRRRITQFIRQYSSYKIVCVFVKVNLGTCLVRNLERGRTEKSKVIKQYYENIMNNPPSKFDGFDEIITVDNFNRNDYTSLCWTTDEPWPEGWYRDYHA